MTDLYLVLAQVAPARNPQQELWSTFSMMAIIFLIFYFLVLRPQQRQLKEHRKLLASLQKGDNIITSGGLHGKIVEVAERVLTVEIADKVRVRLNREAVTGVVRADGSTTVVEPEKK